MLSAFAKRFKRCITGTTKFVKVLDVLRSHAGRLGLNRSESNHTRRLAVANRSRVSIRVTKKIGQGRGCGRPYKIFLSGLITMQNLVAAVCHTVWAYVGSTIY